MVEYLTDIPNHYNVYGINKVLLVRRETIHLKHILTEVFVKKSIHIQKFLSLVDLSIDDYICLMTNRLRHVFKFSREFNIVCNDIIKTKRTAFFPNVELFKDLNSIVVLDFDGVMTNKNFHYLYRLLMEKSSVHICSANPGIREEWFIKRDLPIPEKIHSMRGKKKKLKRLIELQKRHDQIFYIDDEKSYLEFAWAFGIQTFHWHGNKIRYFSLKDNGEKVSTPQNTSEQFLDKRGRLWEKFTDRSYFDLICVRVVGETDFNSELSFHFVLEKEANDFIRLIKNSH